MIGADVIFLNDTQPPFPQQSAAIFLSATPQSLTSSICSHCSLRNPQPFFSALHSHSSHSSPQPSTHPSRSTPQQSFSQRSAAKWSKISSNSFKKQQWLRAHTNSNGTTNISHRA